MESNRPPRRRHPDTDPGDSVLVAFRVKPLPPGEDHNGGVRYGVPARSPSLPPPDDGPAAPPPSAD